jgi:tubulin--tyrosine ligase-like protein 12
MHFIKLINHRSDVFLVDHAWTTTPERARKELKENPNLLERMYHMMGFKEEEEEETEEENKDTQHEGDEDEEMIHTLMEQTGVTREKARETLINERWDLLSAISVRST